MARDDIDPNLLINGLEPVTALAREYMNDVGLARLLPFDCGAQMPECLDSAVALDKFSVWISGIPGVE